MLYHNTKSLAHLLLLASMIVGIAMADSSEDKGECVEELAGIGSCLPYVEGETKNPEPDCCSGLKQAVKTNKKCLCLVIKNRNDPDLGIQMNVTLTLNLPKVCNAPTNVSKCPEVLHMDPKSPEAQVFYQLNNSTSKIGPSPAPTPSVGASSARSQATSSTQKRLFGLEVLAAGLLVWLLFDSAAGNFFIWIPM